MTVDVILEDEERIEDLSPLVDVESKVGNAVEDMGINSQGGLVLRDMIGTHVVRFIEDARNEGNMVWTEPMTRGAHILDLYLRKGRQVDGISWNDRKELQKPTVQLINYIKLADMLGLPNTIDEDRPIVQTDLKEDNAVSLLTKVEEKGALELYRGLLEIATGEFGDTETLAMTAYLARQVS